jgi:hypothetical protein
MVISQAIRVELSDSNITSNLILPLLIIFTTLFVRSSAAETRLLRIAGSSDYGDDTVLSVAVETE